MFVCQNCGAIFLKWFGKCPECGEWNTLQEEDRSEGDKKKKERKSLRAYQVDELSSHKDERIVVGITEFDRVLGGGIVMGSTILIAGEPGVGKSTLLSEISAKSGRKVLYISSEESPLQVANRVRRVMKDAKNVYVMFEGSIDSALSYAEDFKPEILIIDSVQSFFSEDYESSPGSVSQVREVADRALKFSKKHGVPIFLVGHVTKEGVVAGPKTLEHMVDVVLYLESEGPWRILRATKNRFGSTGEIGIFNMTEHGLEEVPDPSTIFLREDFDKTPGSAISAVVEGSRAYLIEVQALQTRSHFQYPRRVVYGYDIVRVNTLIAVIERVCDISLWDKDIYVNIAGGMRIFDVSADLGVVAAILSSYFQKPIGRAVFFGEVGLLGEIRPASFVEQRIRESERIKPQLIISGCNNKKIKTIKNIRDILYLFL